MRIFQAQGTSVCFWLLPPSMHADFDMESPVQKGWDVGTSEIQFYLYFPKFSDFISFFPKIPPFSAHRLKLNNVAPELKRRMVERGGRMMLAYQPLACKQHPNFFRLTFHCHPLNTTQEIDALIVYLIELAYDL